MSPNILHIGNIANIAYASCKVLIKYGQKVTLITHDENHLMSQPEWNDLELDPNDFPDENNFFNNKLAEKVYKRPPWYQRKDIFTQSHGIIRTIGSYLPLSIKKLLKPLYSYLIGYKQLRSSSGNKGELDEVNTLNQFVENVYADAKKWGLTKSDLYAYLPHAQWLYEQNQNYDVSFAYAVAPIYCMLGSAHPYVAIEIGTLRDIPPQDSVLGKILALSYQKASYVLVTNPDVRPLLEGLGIKKYKFCPHPVDEDVYKPLESYEIKALRKQISGDMQPDFIVMAPARQNWQIKGNYKYLEAIKRLKDEGIIILLVVPLWGQDIEKTQKYALELGISSQIKWIHPLPEPTLIKYFSAVDAVLDQFELGVFGFVTAKALACGVPVLTSYDPETHTWCFDEHPPILGCSSTQDIISNLKKLLDNDYRRDLQLKSRQWFLEYHSSSVVNSIMSDVIKKILKKKSK